MKASTATLQALLAALTLSLVCATTSGCGDDDDGGSSNSEPGIERFVSDLRVSGEDIVAVLMPGDPPAASGGPVIMAPDSATVNPGVTVQSVPITSDEEFSTLFLEIPGSSGFWVLDFGSIGGGAGAGTGGGTTVNVDVTFGANPPDANFDCLFSGSEGGTVGPDVVTSIEIEDCTVADFCDGLCDPVEALPCAEYCQLPIESTSCILEASATVVCLAGLECEESASCSVAGQCVADVSDGAISASCAEDFCELLESAASNF